MWERYRADQRFLDPEFGRALSRWESAWNAFQMAEGTAEIDAAIERLRQAEAHLGEVLRLVRVRYARYGVTLIPSRRERIRRLRWRLLG